MEAQRQEERGKKTYNPAKAYLSRYRALLLRYEDLTASIREMEARATNTAARIKPVNVQSGGPNDMIGETAAAVVDAESLLEDTTREIVEEMRKILQIIETVPDEMQKTILTKRYISGKPWSAICAEIGYEKTRVHQLHGWALLSVTRALEAQ